MRTKFCLHKGKPYPFGLYRNPLTFFFTNPEITVCMVDIVLHRCISLLQKAFLTPEPCGVTFYDGFMHFTLFKNQQPFPAIIKLGRARDCYNITLIVFV